MFRPTFQFVVVAALLVLLAVLAVLQVVWLGRVGEAEKERLTRRLQSDSSRVAEDFNREVSGIFLNFQSPAAAWKAHDWRDFGQRLDFWLSRSEFPDLVSDFYYVESDPQAPLRRWDDSSRAFVAVEKTESLAKLTSGLFGDSAAVNPVDRAGAALRIRFAEHGEGIEKLLVTATSGGRSVSGRTEYSVTTDKPGTGNAPPKPPPPPPAIDLPPVFGVLVIKLDERVIGEKLLPALVAKAFPDGDFKLSVSNGDRLLYGDPTGGPADISTGLFDISPDNLIFFNQRDAGAGDKKGGEFRVNQIVVGRTDTVSRVEMRRRDSNSNPGNTSRVSVFTSRGGVAPALVEATRGGPSDLWTLNARHVAGSIDAFVGAGRRRNLAVSFGILGLLGACVVAVFVSAQRVRAFAQRQVEFVSSVSHEFRTPVAVIYSAGENLADGVAAEPAQVERYGRLITKEGRKLSNMVEQILEFAGAESGRRRFEFAEADANEIVREALADCESLLGENGFEVETSFAPEPLKVRADRAALGRAVSNLVANSVKYSNGTKWLRVGVERAGGRVVVTVADRGLGISAADRKRIFEPFFRSREVIDRQISGNGLGLSLVRETVIAHGGSVGVESEPGRGSVFTLRLPVAGGAA